MSLTCNLNCSIVFVLASISIRMAHRSYSHGGCKVFLNGWGKGGGARSSARISAHRMGMKDSKFQGSNSKFQGNFNIQPSTRPPRASWRGRPKKRNACSLGRLFSKSPFWSFQNQSGGGSGSRRPKVHGGLILKGAPQ